MRIFRTAMLAAAVSVGHLAAGGAAAEPMIMSPLEDYGKVNLSERQSTAAFQFEVNIGRYNNEPIVEYGEDSPFRRLGRPIGRLDIATDIGIAPCTAFVVSPEYVLTNWHCVPGVVELTDATQIIAVSLLLGYTREGVEEGTRRFQVSPVPVETDRDLDYAILRVFGDPSTEFGILPLAVKDPLPDRYPYWIVGHPMERAQHISREQCRSDRPAFSSGRLRHTCDTLPGNSGSPVIDPELRAAVALHHAGSSHDEINFAIPVSLIARRSEIVAGLVETAGLGVPADDTVTTGRPAADEPGTEISAAATPPLSEAARVWSEIAGSADRELLCLFAEQYPDTIQAALAERRAGRLGGCGGDGSTDAEPGIADDIGRDDVIVVAADGTGDYRSIADAVRTAEPGARIEVLPGRYSGGVDVDKPLEIVGVGRRADIVWEADEDDVIYWTAPSGRIENLTMRLVGGNYFTVDFDGGAAELVDSDLTSEGLAVVAIRNGSEAVVRDSVIRDGAQGGVLVYARGAGRIEGNEIFGNAFAGVEIREGGDPVVTGNTIRDGRQGGVFVQQNGRGRIERNEIFGNAFAGVEIATGADPMVSDNVIRDGRQGGVFVQNEGKGRIEGNEIFSNALAGIEIKSGGDPVVVRNTIRDGRQGGVLIQENGEGRIEANEIFGNTIAGIEIRTGSDPVVTRNTIRDGKAGGIFVYQSGRGRIEGNAITGNAFTGIEVKDGGDPVVTNNTFRDNGDPAIWVYDGGKGTYTDNDMSANGAGGILIGDDAGRIVRRGNAE